MRKEVSGSCICVNKLAAATAEIELVRIATSSSLTSICLSSPIDCCIRMDFRASSAKDKKDLGVLRTFPLPEGANLN